MRRRKVARAPVREKLCNACHHMATLHRPAGGCVICEVVYRRGSYSCERTQWLAQHRSVTVRR